MIEEFYGFTKTPFTRQMTEEALFETEQFEEILARLQYAAQNSGLHCLRVIAAQENPP